MISNHSGSAAPGLATLAPALLMLWLVAATDRRPEPPVRIVVAFLVGVLAIFVARLLRIPFHFLAPTPAEYPWLMAMQKALFVAAVPEELAKVGLLAWILSRRHVVEEPMDGVVYGAATGLGFAAWENLGYFLTHTDDWRTLAIMRNLLTAPFHCALGMIAGALLAASKHAGTLGGQNARYRHVRLVALAFLVPIILHALFDFPVLVLHDHVATVQITQTVLQISALVFGSGAVVIAARQAVRLANRQKVSRRVELLATQERRVLAAIFAGATLAFAGVWLAVANLSAEYIMKPKLIVGLLFVVCALVIFAWARTRLLQIGSAAI